MDDSALSSIITDMRPALETLTKLGVCDVRFVSAFIGDKRGLNCLIFASDELFDHLAAAGWGQYSERLVLILSAIIRSLKRQEAAGLAYTASEAVALAFHDEDTCRRAGVTYQGDYFAVPASNLLSERDRLISTGQEPNDTTLANIDAWGQLIMNTPFFDADKHNTWLSFGVYRPVPPTQQAESDLLASLAQVQYGWNYTQHSTADPQDETRDLRRLLMQCIGR